MDVEYIRKNNLIIFEAISGSQAYGTNTPESDIDIRGVFVLPKEAWNMFCFVQMFFNAIFLVF